MLNDVDDNHWHAAIIEIDVSEAAAMIVPVLSAFGESDVAEDPRLEHKTFCHVVDFSSLICPRMGHMHNCASTREVFWSRIHHWGEHVDDLKHQ